MDSDESIHRNRWRSEKPTKSAGSRSSSSDVVVATSSLSWVHRFEIRGAWPFVSAAEVEERFEQLVRRRWLVSSGAGAAPHPHTDTPPADVFVVDGEVWVEVDLPGVDPDSVQVELQGRDLLIEAERRTRVPAQGARAAAVERPQGRVRRRIPLPLWIGAARVELHYEGGILQVHIRPQAESEAERS